MIIDGKKIAQELRIKLKKKIIELKSTYNSVPGLTVILIGEDPASMIYVKNKEKSAKEIGINSQVIRYPKNVEEKIILDKIIQLNKDKNISGILVQLPLPKHINKRKVIETILPGKDVDGFHPMNVGNLSSGYDSNIPCTPLGCYLLLKKVEKNLNGKHAVIIGRSNLNGKPMAQLLLKENCTVTITHSKTKDLKAECLEADIIVAAVGIHELEHSIFNGISTSWSQEEGGEDIGAWVESTNYPAGPANEPASVTQAWFTWNGTSSSTGDSLSIPVHVVYSWNNENQVQTIYQFFDSINATAVIEASLAATSE